MLFRSGQCLVRRTAHDEWWPSVGYRVGRSTDGDVSLAAEARRDLDDAVGEGRVAQVRLDTGEDDEVVRGAGVPDHAEVVLGPAQHALVVVVDLDDPWIVRPDSPLLTKHPKVVRRFVARLEANPSWQKIFERDHVLVFRHVESRS